MKTSVVICEDNGDFRDALVQLLNASENFTCIGAFHNCLNVAQDIKQLKPQVILMDIDMNGMTGIEGVKIIRSFDTEVKIIILTVFDDNKKCNRRYLCRRFGLSAKKIFFEKIIWLYYGSIEGGAPMSANIARMVIDHVAAGNFSATEKFDLTAREKDILTGLVKEVQL